MENSDPGPSLVVVGNFDGVHRGHGALFAAAAKVARDEGLRPRVLTFHPHPALVLGRTAPAMLTRQGEKIARIQAAAPGFEARVARFDPAFAGQSPEAFAIDVLAGALEARVVVVGRNFRFGKDRAGDLPALERLGAGLGFTTRSLPLEGDPEGPWSSSRVRAALAAGRLDEATRVLGRPPSISGVVVRGDQRGRTIGFPTCNLEGVEEALPPHGVYAVRVDRVLDDGMAGRPIPPSPPDRPDAPRFWAFAPERAEPLADGVLNLGVRPTVAATPALRVEAHLFDRDLDLYGARLRVHLVAHLREERRFHDLEALRAQIARDADEARVRLAGSRGEP